ncbi:MAG: hypothetical protein ABI743_13475, partial [bacterium]
AGSAGTQVSVIGGLTRSYTVAAGSLTEGKLLLENTGETPADIRLYQTDYTFEADGTTQYGAPGLLPRSNAKWLKVTPAQVTIPAHDTATVYFSLQVPSDETLSGTYWSVLMVEPLPPTTTTPDAGGDGGVQVGIRMIQRYAVQIVSTFGTGTTTVAFHEPTVEAGPQGPLFHVDIANTGDFWVKPTTWIELFDASGASQGRFPGNALRLYPGTSGRFTIPLLELPAGSYSALVVADGGDEQVFGTQVPVTLP